MGNLNNYFVIYIELKESLRSFNISNFRDLLNDRVTKSLSEWHQNKRKRICQVNIKVNLIVWLVEFAGCMTLAIDFLLIGSRNNIVTGILGNATMVCFFILLPFTFLINCSAGVNKVVDDSWLDAVTKNFNLNTINEETRAVSDENRISQNSQKSGTPSANTVSGTVVQDNDSTFKMENKVESKINSYPRTLAVAKEAWK